MCDSTAKAYGKWKVRNGQEGTDELEGKRMESISPLQFNGNGSQRLIYLKCLAPIGGLFRKN